MSSYKYLRSILALAPMLALSVRCANADPELFRTLVSPLPQTEADFGFSVACPLSTQSISAGSDIVSGEPFGSPNIAGRTTAHRSSDGALLYNEVDAVSGAALGYRVAAIGDVDKNGFGDFIESAPAFGTLAFSAARIIKGPNTTPIDLASGLSSQGRESTVAGLFSDVNSNSNNEVLVGAPDYSGAVGAFCGAISIVDTSTLIPVGNQIIEGQIANERLGTSIISTSDLDGDGMRDIIVGSPGIGTAGAVRLLSSAQMPVYINLVLGRGIQNDRFGESLAAVPDLTGDGIEEFLVGGPQVDVGPGLAELYRGGSNPQRLCALAGEANFDRFGSAVAGLGDIDGDGNADFAVGAPDALNGVGRVYIYKYDSGTNTCPLIFTLDGTAAGQAFGYSLAGFSGGTLNCDFDSDGHSDFVVGSLDDGATSDEGKVFAFRNVTPTPTQTATPTITPTFTPSATPSVTPTPTVVIPTSARLNYTISTAGTLSANVSLNITPDSSTTCEVRLLGRRSDFDLANRGPIQSLLAAQPITTRDERFIARGLRKPTSASCEFPYIFHMVAGIDCGGGEFFSNIRSRYLTCGRQPEQPIGQWEQSLIANISVGSESAKTGAKSMRRSIASHSVERRPCKKKSSRGSISHS